MLGKATLLAFVVLTPCAVHAQVCESGLEFGATPIVIGAGAAFASGRHAIAALAGAGRNPLFVTGSVAAQYVDAATTNGYSFSGGVGSDHAIDRERRWHYCPVANIGYTRGPRIDTFDTSTVDFSAGGNVFGLTWHRPTVALAFTVGMLVRHERFSAHRDTFALDIARTYATTTFGLALLFNGRTAIVPAFTVPFWSPTTQKAFTIGFIYSLG